MTDVDHYVWEAYWMRVPYDDPSDSVYATTKEKAQELIIDKAGVESGEWVENGHVNYPLFQIHDSEYHVVTVARRPVYGGDGV